MIDPRTCDSVAIHWSLAFQIRFSLLRMRRIFVPVSEGLYYLAELKKTPCSRFLWFTEQETFDRYKKLPTENDEDLHGIHRSEVVMVPWPYAHQWAHRSNVLLISEMNVNRQEMLETILDQYANAERH